MKTGSVLLETSVGPISIELYWDEAPKTCENFHGLAKKGYYDGGGDPSGTGRGGECLWGGKFKDEITDKLKHTGAGILSMANSGPNTNGSQFFITLAPTPWLDGKHTIFGRVSTGMQFVKRMGGIATDKDDRPVNDEVKIIKATAFSE